MGPGRHPGYDSFQRKLQQSGWVWGWHSLITGWPSAQHTVLKAMFCFVLFTIQLMETYTKLRDAVRVLPNPLQSASLAWHKSKDPQPRRPLLGLYFKIRSLYLCVCVCKLDPPVPTCSIMPDVLEWAHADSTEAQAEARHCCATATRGGKKIYIYFLPVNS